MKYRSFNGRCSVILDSLSLPISNEKALVILKNKGFEKIEVNILEIARQCKSISLYQRGARISLAPVLVDCSSLMKYLYAQLGILIPRRSIQQRELGEVVAVDELVAGDLVFVSGCINYYYDDPSDGVGHVGIVTENKTIIHALNGKKNVVETSLEKFIKMYGFRGARRYIPKGVEVLTFKIPPNRDVETDDDLRWIILQSVISR